MSTTSQNPIPVWSKLPKTSKSIFTTMSALAQETNAINLSQGYPDFDCAADLQELVTKYMGLGYNQYAPMAGVSRLLENIANKIDRLYNCELNPTEEITITAGATQAIYTAITSLIRENDEVIVFEPAYDSYVPTIQLSGGKPIYIRLSSPDFSIPWRDVKKLISGRTRMIIINTPHNPTGNVLTKKDYEELMTIVKNSNILLLFDEVYEHIVFDEHQHLSALSFPELRERSLVTFSFGKTFHNTGWKVGYCVAPPYLTKEFRKVHQFITFSVNTPAQYALADYLMDENNYKELSAFYQEKRDFFLDAIKDSRFQFTPAQGTYFQILDYSRISEANDLDFAVELTRKHKVASIPLSPFYSNQQDFTVLRFCFAKKRETLARAAEILNKC